tara:strand:+ start:8522 stop:8806 length:285 start_codon:yes stop_codon:yes gene_type:complete
MSKLFLSAGTLYLCTACQLMDSMINTPTGPVRLGDAVAGEVEAYTPAVTDGLGAAIGAATGNPVLGGALAAALLGVSAFAVKKLRKAPPEQQIT